MGNFINYYLHTHKLKKKDLAAGLDVSYNTFSRYLSQTSIQFTILWRISKILNYNFLMDLGEWLDIPYETKAEKELKWKAETTLELALKTTWEWQKYLETRK